MSKLPGPPAYPIVGNSLLFLGKNIDHVSKIFKLLQDYDSFLRLWIGPVPFVAISKPDYTQEILTNTNSLEKPFIMKYLGKEAIGNSLLISDVSKWKHNRRIITRGFTPTILKSYFQIFVEKSLILTEKLDKKITGTKSFDIFEYLSKTALDSICGSTMGVNVNAQNNKFDFYLAIENFMRLSVDRAFHFWQIPKFIYVWSKNCKTLNECMDTIKAFANEIILEKRKYYSNGINKNKDNNINKYKRPFLENLIDFTETDSNFTDEDLRDESNLVILAGYETSAVTLSYVLLNLAAHKDVQNKVFDELCFALKGDLSRTIDVDDLPKLKYMELVIKESMRLHPTVPYILREVTEDIKLGDRFIPKGATCAISIFSLHRDKEIWKNPLTFDPERFTQENLKNIHPFAYIPFSGGPRNCLGIRYAWIFMKTVLATLLSRYEFHTDLNMNELHFEYAISLKLLGGYQIRITPRNNNF